MAIAVKAAMLPCSSRANRHRSGFLRNLFRVSKNMTIIGVVQLDHRDVRKPGNKEIPTENVYGTESDLLNLEKLRQIRQIQDYIVT
jgi:hypothetical protein